MDENEGDHFREVGITTSFSQLLFSDIGKNDVLCSDLGPLSDDRFFSSKQPPRMLCFDGYNKNNHNQKSAVICSESSPDYSSATAAACVNVNTPPTKPNRRRNGSRQELDKRNTATIAKTASTTTQRSSKKMKMENPCQPKARKEKLGERIAALQQLVSPFGKTDTASVLHEAMGYIKFLHDQLQVLCSPYLQPPPPEGKENGVEERATKALRSTGLCLVPVDCTIHVASTNGADYWSPAAMSATRQ